MAQVILLRGVNVGGAGKLLMADLRAHVAELGGGRVLTYIQSGNCVCSQAVDPDALADRINQAQGFCPKVMAFSETDWRGRLDTFPFAQEDPRKCMRFFTPATSRWMKPPLRSMC